MNSETSSPVKSAKRVIIRIDPVPDVLNNDGQLSGTEKSFSYEETARYVTPDEEINGICLKISQFVNSSGLNYGEFYF